MGVRVKIKIERYHPGQRAAILETVAVANSGFEADGPEIILPLKAAGRLALWPAPPEAFTDRFESPGASLSLLALERAVVVSLAGKKARGVLCDVVYAEHESEVVMNDHLVEALKLSLIAPARGLYRIGRKGPLLRSSDPEHW